MLTGYPALLSKFNLLEETKLLQRLVKCCPVYASSGLNLAQQLLQDYLKKSENISVNKDTFYANEIKHLPSYVDVTSFGPIYKNYESVEKRNIIAILDSGLPGRTLILNGHIDVDLAAPSLHQGEIIGNTLYGRGSADMLGGLTALAAILKYFSGLKSWRGKLILTAVTDEEIGGNGTLRALEFLKKQELICEDSECLIAEPSNNMCSLSSMGFLHFKLTFNRVSSHMGVATRQNNSIWDVNEFLNNVDIIFSRAGLNDIIYNFGIINGGSDAAIPLEKIILEGTVFFPPSISSKELESKIINSLLQYQHNINVSFSDFRFEGASFKPTALHSLLKEKIPSGQFPSPCDARLFKEYAIPTIIYGPGELKNAHSPNECLCLSDWRSYIYNLLQIIFEHMQ